MRTGKLPPDLLTRLLGGLTPNDHRVRIGPTPGEDAAVLTWGSESLVVTADPVTFVTDRAGWYAVHVNANDIAAMGGEPLWFCATLLLPADVTEPQIEKLFAELHGACVEVGATLITGHTEITDAVRRTVVSGSMLGLLEGEATSSARARPGDLLLVAGLVGVEGTAILAAEAAPALRAAGITTDELEDASALLARHGISVRAAARALRPLRPHALHDVTEGGLATAVREMAEASGVGLELDAGVLPFAPVTLRFSAALGIDRLGLISSGCLLAAVEPASAAACTAALARAGVTATVAGRFTVGRELTLIEAGRRGSLPAFDRDELARFLEEHPDR